MEPQLVNRITVRSEQEKPDLNKEEEAKQTLEKNTSKISSSSSSSGHSPPRDSSSQRLEHHKIEEPFESSRFDPTSPYSWSMVSASPPPTELIGHSFSDVPAVHDPNRIPESVFSAVPSSPARWSAASNESLFSIHMGNNSFTHDHPILYAKSGELRRLDDLCNQGVTPSPKYSSEPIISSSGLPTVVEETSGRVSRAESFHSRISKVSGGTGMESGAGPDPNTGPLGRDSVNLSNNARFSEESGNSDGSFAFPVLVGDGVKMESLGSVDDIPEEPHLEEQVQDNVEEQVQANKKSSDRKRATKRRWCSRICCWRRSHRGD